MKTPPTSRSRSGSSSSASEWVRDERGRIMTGEPANIRAALERLQIQPTYDAFARELRLNGITVLDDIVFEQVWLRIADTFHWQPNRNNLRTVIVVDAHDLALHPVRAYLDALVWDGVKRLDEWLITYAGAVTTEQTRPYVLAVSALPLVAAVRRIRCPGTKFDELLILESPQGTGKSSALRALCANDDWFSDDLPLGVDAKVVIERTAGKWIIEAAELHGNRGRETDTLKAFLSRQQDGPVRLAYGRYSTTVPRQFIQIGTTNHHGGYLKDLTGARRFWPVEIQQFDLDKLTADRDQLWAEAVHHEPQASLRLPQALWKAAHQEQEARRAVDPWEELIEPLLRPDQDGDTVWARDIWNVLGVEANVLDNRQADRVAAILERRQYRKYRAPGRGNRGWKRATHAKPEHDPDTNTEDKDEAF